MFTEADIKTLLRAAVSSSAPTPHSPSTLPLSLELVSGGLILEKHARSIIEKAIFSERPGIRFISSALVTVADINYLR